MGNETSRNGKSECFSPAFYAPYCLSVRSIRQLFGSHRKACGKHFGEDCQIRMSCQAGQPFFLFMQVGRTVFPYNRRLY